MPMPQQRRGDDSLLLRAIPPPVLGVGVVVLLARKLRRLSSMPEKIVCVR